MRAAKAITALLVIAFALLLMSALVVCDAPEADIAPENTAPLRVTLLPVALPASDSGAALAPSASAPRALSALIMLSLIFAPAIPVARDANGRVLSSARYENSFYPVFRPEVAGG